MSNQNNNVDSSFYVELIIMLSAQVNSTTGGWTSDAVKRLIKSVKHTCYLYDPRNPKHFDQNIITRGWEIVSQMVGKPASECRLKWDHIASQLKKIEQNRKDSNSTPNWVYYNLIAFMLPFIQTSTPTKRDRSPDAKEIDTPTREKMTKITPNNSSTSNGLMKPETYHNMAVVEYEVPAGEPTQFISAIGQITQNDPILPNSTNSSIDHYNPDLVDDVVSSNTHFLTMILKEMTKLSKKDQSQYRIMMLTKLHEMLYKND